LGEEQVLGGLERLVDAVLALSLDPASLVLVGIQRGGFPVAQALRAGLQAPLGLELPLGSLDINLYRDDLFEGHEQPLVGPTDLPFDLAGKNVLLIDDVLYTGRTVRAAIDALMDFGRPRRVLLVALVDRGGRELPIQPDVVGISIDVAKDSRVQVHLAGSESNPALADIGATRAASDLSLGNQILILKRGESVE